MGRQPIPHPQCSSITRKSGVFCISVRSKLSQRHGRDGETPVDPLGSWRAGCGRGSGHGRECCKPNLDWYSRIRCRKVVKSGRRVYKVLEEGIGESGRIGSKDPMWGQLWTSPQTSYPTRHPSRSLANTPQSSYTPVRNYHPIHTLINTPAKKPASFRTPANAPASLHTPAITPATFHIPANTPASFHTPANTPTDTTFKSFIQQEMKTLQNTSPLHALLSMDSFWSPHAPHASKDHLPGSPTNSKTSPAPLLSPWKGVETVMFSPSLFNAQAFVVRD